MSTEELGERFNWYESRITLEAVGRMCTLEPSDNRRSFIGTRDNGDGIRVSVPGFFPIPPGCESLEAYLHWLPAAIPRVCIILVRSGYGAVAVCGAEGIEHAKVVRRYTVRKGQGGAQTTRQSKRPAKSAGARLRMRESQNFWNDMVRALSAWRDPIASCERIYLGSTPQVTGELFASPVKNVLSRQDPRLVPLGLPFAQPSKIVLEKVYRELGMGYWVMRPRAG